MSSQHIYTTEEFIEYGDRLHYNTIIDCIANVICGSGYIARNFGHFWGQYFQYGIMHITVSCVGCSIVASLFYQLSSLNGNVNFFHSFKGVTIILLTMILYPLPSFAIVIPMQDFDESAEYIKTYYINAYNLFVTVSSCHALIPDLKGKAHYGTLALQVCCVWVLLIIVVLKIHQKLAALKNVLSPATLKARQQLLIALLFQMTIPFTLIVFPLVIMLISVIVNAQYSNTISTIAMPIMALHSTVNSLSILYIIMPYRKAVFNGIKKILRIKQKPKQALTGNSTRSLVNVNTRNGQQPIR